MRTLLERLKPEYLELLEADSENFIFLVENVKKELSENNNVHTLKFTTAYRLSLFCEVSLGIRELNNLFLKE